MGIPNDDPRFGAPLFKGVGTFMGVPASRDLSGAKAAVLGIPFDCGLHPVRLGARLGPIEIRRQSSLVRPFQPPLWQVSPRARALRCSRGSRGSTSSPPTSIPGSAARHRRHERVPRRDVRDGMHPLGVPRGRRA